uniref:Uncharacterized protein n=1 Tax=Avena sativa TaxID=4498 RepID=A0ACD5TCU2_AVESA
MNPLLLKLGTLMGDEYKKLKGVKKQASFLIRELGAMKAALEKLELMDKLDSQAKDWRGHVREMSYDMEDCIDDFTCDLGDVNAKQSFIKKNIRRFKFLGARHHIAQHMEDLKALALEANERRMRYRIDDRTNPSSGIVLVDPRISAIYKEAAGLVGIDGPKKEIVNWLTNNEKKLKVVSIVGFGGLGKTTLAKQVYDKMRGKFTCQAFVSVSQRPDMISLLSGLQLKLGVGKEESSRACETQDIIGNIRKRLTRRRYLIIVDDLWDQSTWNIISCAFTENGDLEYQMTVDLTAISKLFHLRYLKVSANQYVKLPTEMQGLIHLETLELGCKLEMPSDVVHLPRLSHLIVLNGAELPQGIRNMKSLRTLDGFDLRRSSMDDIRGLAVLTNLRSLRLSSMETRNKFVAVVSSIGMLHNLRYLHIKGYYKDEDRNDMLASLSDPPRYIMVLELPGVTFPRVPKWFGSLQCLRHLELCVWETSTEEVRFLGELPPLVYLSFEVMSFNTAVIFSTGIFTVLEDFKCISRDNDVTAYLVFEVGATVCPNCEGSS